MTTLLLGTVASAYTVTAEPIVFKTQLGTGTSTSAGTTITITTSAAIAVDDLVVVRWAADNSDTNNPTATCTDSGSNTYIPWASAVSSGSVTNGVAGGLLASKATSAVSSGGTITITLSASVAHKAASALSFTGAANAVRGSSATAVATTGTAASSGASTSATSGDLVIGQVAAETRTTPTGDSDTSNGSWSTLVTVNSTTGGTDNTRVQVNGQYKIVTGAGTQTYDNTLGASTDWVASTVVFRPSAAYPSKQSVRFDNSADIYSGSSAASDVSTTNFTICLWCYRVSTAAFSTMAAIQRAGPDQYFILAAITGNGFQLINNGTSISTNLQTTLNAWTFVACTYNSGTGKIYLGRTSDSALLETSSTGHTGPNTAASVRIGNDTFGGQRFDGRIGAVKMWNATLSAAELEAERWWDHPVRTSNLYAWYPFDEGPSTTDESGNGHTLTASGAITSEAGPPYAG